jgi:hypothetical protein
MFRSKKTLLAATFYALLLLAACPAQAQQQASQTVASLVVTEGTYNKTDVTDDLRENEVYVVLYKAADDPDTLRMAIVWPKIKSQIYGPAQLQSSRTAKDKAGQESDVQYFRWVYDNTYYKQSGRAKVRLVTRLQGEEATFELTILDDNGDVTIYKGYMDLDEE